MSRDFLKKLIVNNQFLILDEIGEGNAGIVYKGKSLRDLEYCKKDDVVAIKKYKKNILQEQRQSYRIYHELRSGIEIKTENVVKTYDLIEYNDDIFLIMEYLEGKTLTEWLKDNQNNNFETIVNLSLEILNGLAEIHKESLIHRDLKPDNIIITDKRLIIMDLGVIKDIKEATITINKKFLGTIKYSAPEYLFGYEYNEKTDVYSFGLILYELIFNKHLLKTTYWSRNIFELAINYYEGPQHFLPNDEDFPDRFSDKQKLFFWKLLCCILGENKYRPHLSDVIHAFKDQLWKKINSYTFIDDFKLKYTGNEIFINDFLFLKKLEKIILEAINLKGIKSSRIKIPLEIIDDLTKIHFGVELNQGHIENLQIIKIDITEIPYEIGLLKNLKSISLSSTHLRELPASFGSLPNLINLYLVGNSIKNLPDSFSNLRNLEFINFISTGLKTLPDGFNKLKNLKKLVLDLSDFLTFPDCFENFKELEELFLLSVPNNLPLSFQYLENLQDLVIVSKSLTEIPFFINNLKHLKRLKILSTGLEIIPNELCELEELVELTLSGNKIKVLPKNIGNLKSLEKLKISSNPIEKLPESIQNLKNLIELDILSTIIIELPSTLLKLPKLKVIFADFKTQYCDVGEELKKRNVEVLTWKHTDYKSEDRFDNGFDTVLLKSRY